MKLPKNAVDNWTHHVEVYHITDNSVKVVIDRTAFLEWVHITVSAAGTKWTVGVRNKEETPKYAIPLTTTADPGADVSGAMFNPNPPRLLWMEGGIEVVTEGQTPGIMDVWVTFYKETPQ